MKLFRHSRLLHFAGLLLSMLVWLANNGNPPTGKTGAPFDGHCNECHSGNNPGGFDGDMTIDGLPGAIDANTTYPLTVTITPTAGSPTKGGFQLVVVDNNNANCGDLTAGNAQSGTEFFASREYLEHRNGKAFNGNPISWTFTWKSPATVSGNTVKFYYVANFTNGNGQDTGDFPKEFSASLPFNGPPPLNAVISSSTNVLCFGGNTGSATVDASGGVAPYTYHWSNNQSSQTAINLTAGTYSVTVTGSSGSGTATASVTITQPPALTLSTNVSGQLTCLQTSVTATATAGGGTPGYDISWGNGQTGSEASFTDPGTYGVTLTDANGCSKTGTVNVTQNITPPNAFASTGNAITCTQLTSTVSGSGSSQGPNFSYHWTTQGGNIVSGGNSITAIVNSCATYTLIVTNTLNGCTSSASTTVECQIDPPDVAASNNGPLTCVVQNATLSGTSNTAGVTFSWTGPNGYTSTVQNPVVNVPGSYTLVVFNPANNCSNSAQTTLSQNILPPSDTAHTSGMITCATDSVQIYLTTNAQNATYLWSGPNGFTSTQRVDTIGTPGDYIGIITNVANGCKSRDTVTIVQNTAPPGATAAVSGPLNCAVNTVQLTGGPSGNNTYHWTGPNNFSSSQQNTSTAVPGVYTLSVTADTNSCVSTATVTVQQNITPPTATIAAPGNLNCNTASLQLNATGSSQGGNFNYTWTTSDGMIMSGGNTLTPLIGAAGTYQLLVTNTNNSCTATASVTVVQTPPVTASIGSVVDVSCNGGSNGSASGLAGGGNGVYTYLWSNGATTSFVNGLAAGVYIFTVTDGQNCTATASVTISQPTALHANATATGETSLGANDGTATAAPTGGAPAYTYNWSNGASTAQITGLVPGSYTVSVTDANGCSVVQSVTVNAFGCTLQSNISSTNISCNGANNGTATVSLTGAADPVSFTWSNGNSSQSVMNLAPGVYTVSVVDGNNCPAVLNTMITEPAAISPNATVTSETSTGANNGTATANPTGGTGAYTYAWSNGGDTESISNLAPGVYTVSVTDANNCTATQSVTVNAFNCTLNTNISGANVSCFGGNNGQATIAVSGGLLPYTYLWSNGTTTNTATGLVAGAYTVVATDAAGCSATESILISEPDQLNADVISVQNVVCPNDHTGSVQIDIGGGMPPYTVTGATSNLDAGVHTVQVTDENQCSTSVTFTVMATDNVPPILNCPANIYLCGADIVSYPTPTATDNCGQVSLPVLVSGLPSGGVFNDGTTTQIYRATDDNGNTSTCSFSVVVYPIPDIVFNGITDDHNGQGVGSILISIVGGTGPYIYVWKKNGQLFSNDEDLTNLFAGTYTLVITDANSCTTALAPVIINNTVGIEELGDNSSVRLWPNPATASFYLEFTNISVEAAMIMDTRGKLIQELKPEQLLAPVDVQGLSNGVYFLKMATSKGKVLTLRFVKAE